MNESKKQDIEHLRHMETAILSIFVALTIISFSQLISGVDFGPFIQVIFLITFVISLMLSFIHLHDLILNNKKMRVRNFVISTMFLIVTGMTFILMAIQTGLRYLLKFDFFSVEGLLVYGLGTIIGIAIILMYLKRLFKNKIIPTFQKNIFPNLWKEYGFNPFELKIKKEKDKDGTFKKKSIKKKQPTRENPESIKKVEKAEPEKHSKREGNWADHPAFTKYE